MTRKTFDSEAKYRQDKSYLRFWAIVSLVLVSATFLFSLQRNSTPSVGLDLQLPNAPSYIPVTCVELPEAKSLIEAQRMAAARVMNATTPETRQILAGTMDQYLFGDETSPEPDDIQCFDKNDLNKARQHFLPTD